MTWISFEIQINTLEMISNITIVLTFEIEFNCNVSNSLLMLNSYYKLKDKDVIAKNLKFEHSCMQVLTDERWTKATAGNQ